MTARAKAARIVADPFRRERMVERMIESGRMAREAKRESTVNAARDSVLDALDEETEKLSWAAERDLLTALREDLELRISDNGYRKPVGRTRSR